MFRRNGNRWGVQKQFGPFLRFPYAGPRVGIVLNNRGHNHFHGVVCARTRRIQYGETEHGTVHEDRFPSEHRYRLAQRALAGTSDWSSVSINKPLSGHLD